MEHSVRVARAPICVLLGTVLLLPAAQALVVGNFLVDSPVELPSGSTIEAWPIAALVGGNSQGDGPLAFTSFLLQADKITLTEYSMSAVYVIPPLLKPAYVGTQPVAEHQVLYGVKISVIGEPQPGYLGLNGTTAATSAAFTTNALATLKAIDSSHLKTADSSSSSRDDSTYQNEVRFAHLGGSVPGTMRLHGPAELKVWGITLLVEHSNGTEEIRTGLPPTVEQDSGSPTAPARGGEERWVVIEAENLSLEATPNQPWQLASGPAALRWSGTAAFHATDGTLDEAGKITSTVRRAVKLSGVFNGEMLALQNPGAVHAQFSVEGEPLFTSGSSRTSLPDSGFGFTAAILVGVAVGAVAGGMGGALVWRRHRAKAQVVPVTPVEQEAEESAQPTPDLAAEYYVGLAEQAIQFEDYSKALHWITLAREAAPTSANVVTTQAYVLGELGQYDEALAAYEEAAQLDPSDGEADLNAGRLAAQAGKPPEVVEAFVLRALERTPEFVFDVEEDPEFRPLGDRLAFRKGLSRAWERWGGGEENAAH